MPEQVKNELQKLKSELEQINSETKLLEMRITEAHDNLEEMDDAGMEGLINDVQTEVRRLEVDHPQLTSLLNQVMTALSNWGI